MLGRFVPVDPTTLPARLRNVERLASAASAGLREFLGVLMTEDSSFHWLTKRRHFQSGTARRAGLESVCVFGHEWITGTGTRDL